MGVFDKINKSDASPSSGGGVFGKIKKTNDYNNARGASETNEQYQYAHQWDNDPASQAIIAPLQPSQPSFAERAQGFNAPDEKGNFRTNFPGGIFNPLNDLNRLNNSPLLRSFNRGAGATMGVPDDMMDPRKTSYVPSMDSFNRQSAANLPENNHTLGEKLTGALGSMAGFMVNPAMPVGNLSPISNFFENPKIQQVSNALGNKTQGLLGSAGMALNKDGTQIIDSLLGKSLNKAVTGTTRNALGMAAYSPFHTLMAGQDVQDMPGNMVNDTLAGAAFGPLEGIGPVLGRGIAALKGLKGEVPTINPDVYNQSTGAKIKRATGGMSDSIVQNAANHFTHNLPENVQARAESSLESYKLAMESKYNPSNQNINVWDKMTNKEKGQMNQLTKAIGAESPKTVKQEPPVIEQNAPKSTFNVGEEAIPTTADGADLSGPKKIIDVQSKDGVNYYRFEGDNSYLPDNMVRRAEETTAAPIPNERSNYANQRENGNFSDDFNAEQAKRDTTYEPITNKETVDAVNEEFAKRSVPDIEAEFLSNNELSAKHTGVGYRLIQKLDQAAQKATTQYEKEMYIKKAVHVADKLAADLTRAGQTTQAAAILKRLSPEGQLIQLTNKAKASGKTVKPEDAAKFMELAKERQATMSSGPDTANFYDLLDRIKAGEKVSADELGESVKSMLKEVERAGTKPEKAPKEVKPRVRDKVLAHLEREAEAARKRIKARRNMGFVPTGGNEVVDYAIIGLEKFFHGVRKFSSWSESMIEEFGNSVKPHLQKIFNQNEKLMQGKFNYENVWFNNEASDYLKSIGRNDLAKVADSVFNDNFFEMDSFNKNGKYSHLGVKGNGVDGFSSFLDVLNKEVVETAQTSNKHTSATAKPIEPKSMGLTGKSSKDLEEVRSRLSDSKLTQTPKREVTIKDISDDYAEKYVMTLKGNKNDYSINIENLGDSWLAENHTYTLENGATRKGTEFIADTKEEAVAWANKQFDEMEKIIGNKLGKRFENGSTTVRTKVLDYLEREATAAKKELAMKNSLGFARQAGTPDIVLWSKVMAHELAKNAVTLADFTELLVKQAGESIRPHAQAIYDGAKSLIGKADKRIGPDKAKIIEKFLKEGKFTPADEKALRGIADEINKLKGKKGIEADMQMQKILNSYEKSSPWGMLQTLRFMAMLGNEATQSLNALSGPLMMTYRHMLDIFLTPFDAALSKVIKGRERQVTFKQGAGVFDDVFTPMVDWFKGLGTGAKAGWHGVDPEGITSQHDIRGLSFKGKYNPLGWGERTLGAVAKSPDYATFNATRNMELRKMAYLDALNKNVKGKDAIQAHMDKFLADPPQQALEASARQGKKTTFQYGDGIAKRAARWGKPLTAAVPFIKTPTNIAITGLENTPAGILKGIFELYQLNKGIDGLYPKEGITQKEIMQTFGSSVTGTFALGGLGYVLGKLGIITGDYDTNNSNVQAVKEASGEGKFKFNRTAFSRMFEALFSGDMDKIKDVSKYRDGDYQLDYNRLQPLAMPVAMGATFEQGKDKPMGERLANTAKSTGASLFGMSALKGITDIGNLPADVKGSDVPLGFLNNIGEGYAKSFSPSLTAAEARRQDPIQRETSYHKGFGEDVGSYFKSRWPGASQELPAKITNLGDVKQNLDPYLNTLKAEKTQYNPAARIINDLIQKTGDEKLAPTKMDNFIKGVKRGERLQSTVTLDPKRYEKLEKDTGQEISKRVIALPENQRTGKKLEEIYAKVREDQRTKLKRELGFKTD